MRIASASVVIVGLAGLSGCASKYIQATVKNASPTAVSELELDYPSASFGKDLLAPGAEYNYRFKILGSGETKITWVDAARKEHSIPGPHLDEGQQGRLTVTLSGDTATWTTDLKQ